MPYVLAAIAAFAFAAGFGTAYKIYSSEADLLRDAIEHSNVVADQQLKLVQSNLQVAEAKADKLNTELENAHESDIETINYYADKLASVRLPKPTRGKSCADSLPTAKNTPSGTKHVAYRTDFSEESLGFLRRESRRADQITSERNLLLSFVQSNCGLSK
jgi:hypothetical protein